ASDEQTRAAADEGGRDEDAAVLGELGIAQANELTGGGRLARGDDLPERRPRRREKDARSEERIGNRGTEAHRPDGVDLGHERARELPERPPDRGTAAVERDDLHLPSALRSEGAKHASRRTDGHAGA